MHFTVAISFKYLNKSWESKEKSGHVSTFPNPHSPISICFYSLASGKSNEISLHRQKGVNALNVQVRSDYPQAAVLTSLSSPCE